ncbi:hypothetical protein LO762_12770 [Actinocorallia sp. API 0066]|uniref:hypothetical protein n=1 Tax=Actinocorallia sp. API 0066 TaxID=2896846 RepID=UPI001E582DD0|nr:hypothetical protein [Actinocorallia sp. API 0066]MCD0450059.1 hypothetical protein [Actinocorallia sp. API 0066]
MTAPPPSPPSPPGSVEHGPYRLTGVLRQTPAGFVFGAVDFAGRAVQVVLLSRGAAGDPAARDRFAAAVRGNKGRLLSYDTANPGPWAVGEGDLGGLLDSVALADERGNPRLIHHWEGASDPAFPVTEAGSPPAGSGGPYLVFPKYAQGGGTGAAFGAGGGAGSASGAGPRFGGRDNPWGTVLAGLALLLLFLLIILGLLWLWRSQPDDLPPEPVETVTSPTPTPGESGTPRPTPTPSPSGPSSPGQDGPTGTGWPDGDNPL